MHQLIHFVRYSASFQNSIIIQKSNQIGSLENAGPIQVLFYFEMLAFDLYPFQIDFRKDNFIRMCFVDSYMSGRRR